MAAAAVVMIFIGWRLRKKLRVYALSLQGGGAGILFLTIFAAFRIWELMPAGLAFALLAALAAFTGALSVLQKARWLIILGAIGGFVAPVLTSTGQGSHVALFSYYLVLNATILGVSWFHAWRAVNLVGFFFTFVIGSFWGYRYYRPEFFTSTEPFLNTFLPVLPGHRHPVCPAPATRKDRFGGRYARVRHTGDRVCSAGGPGQKL